MFLFKGISYGQFKKCFIIYFRYRKGTDRQALYGFGLKRYFDERVLLLGTIYKRSRSRTKSDNFLSSLSFSFLAFVGSVFNNPFPFEIKLVRYD